LRPRFTNTKLVAAKIDVFVEKRLSKNQQRTTGSQQGGKVCWLAIWQNEPYQLNRKALKSHREGGGSRL
jgi:hypothetical protein